MSQHLCTVNNDNNFFKKIKNFKVPTRAQVAPANQTIFDNLNKALGFVPTLYATIAYSDNGLGRYLAY